MKHIQVVAAIFIYKDNEILCMRRGHGRHEYLIGKYEFPGGKIEPGEEKHAALMREIKEEMDLDIEVLPEDYYMTVNYTYPDFEITMHSFLCRVENKDFNRKEHSDHCWLKKEELKKLDWANADLPIVEKIMTEGF